MSALARFLPTLGRASLTLLNALAVLALAALWLGGHLHLLGLGAVLLAVVNAASWPVEIAASFWSKAQPAQLVSSVVRSAGPPVLDWIRDVLDGLARKEIPPAEAKTLAAAHLKAAMDEAERESWDGTAPATGGTP